MMDREVVGHITENGTITGRVLVEDAESHWCQFPASYRDWGSEVVRALNWSRREDPTYYEIGSSDELANVLETIHDRGMFDDVDDVLRALEVYAALYLEGEWVIEHEVVRTGYSQGDIVHLVGWAKAEPRLGFFGPNSDSYMETADTAKARASRSVLEAIEFVGAWARGQFARVAIQRPGISYDGAGRYSIEWVESDNLGVEFYAEEFKPAPMALEVAHNAGSIKPGEEVIPVES